MKNNKFLEEVKLWNGILLKYERDRRKKIMGRQKWKNKDNRKGVYKIYKNDAEEEEKAAERGNYAS